jgi:hypothetical protein
MVDRLWILDARLARGTWFRADGTVESTVSIRRPLSISGSMLLAAGPDGYAWWRSYAPVSGVYVALHDGTAVRRMAADTRPSCSVADTSGNAIRGVTIPFCHQEVEAFAWDGSVRGIAAPIAPRGGAAGVRVLLMRVNGDTVLNRTITVEASDIPARIRDSVAASMRQQFRGRLAEPANRILTDQLLPRTFSPLVDLDISTQGVVLITVTRGPRRERVVLRIEPGRTAVQSFIIRENQEVRWVDMDRFLMVETDEDGLQDVVLYEVSR